MRDELDDAGPVLSTPLGYMPNPSNGTPIFTGSYTRDDAGRIVAKGETALGSTIATSYTYDAAGCLESNSIGNMDVTTYGYDANGNRS